MHRKFYISFTGFLLFFNLLAPPGFGQSPASAETKGAIFLTSDSLSFLGFEFSEGNMFVLSDLVRSYKKNYLQVITETGKTKATAELPGDYTNIYRNCSNHVFVGSKDSVCQVYFRGDSLLFGSPVDIGRFYVIMVNCFFMADGVLFRREEVPNKMNSMVHAVYPDENGKTLDALVFEVRDTLAVECYEQGKPNNTKTFYTSLGKNKRQMVALGTRVRMADQRVKEQNYIASYYNAIDSYNTTNRTNGYHSPVGMTMQFFENSFYIVDYTNGSMAVMDRALSQRKMIDLRPFERHIFSVHFDDVTGDIYFLEGIPKTNILKKYDHQTGRLMFVKNVIDYQPESNTVIYNSRLYYRAKKDDNKPSFALYVIPL